MRNRSLVYMGLAVAAFVLFGHFWSLWCGLFLDDHMHYANLRAGNWSYRSAVDSARLGIVGEVIDLWGRNEASLRFYRPVAFWMMRAEYTIADWQPFAMHAFSLIWHWLCAMLVGIVGWRLIGHAGWAAVAACVMAIHPGHIVTVQWIACQTELMATTFLLAATLCYARYAGWWPDAPVRRAWLAPALLCFALALGCREHAIMWSAVMVVGDFTFRRPLRRQLAGYFAIAAVAGTYLLLRHVALGGFPLPGRPYLMRPSDPGFVRHICEKFVYYVIGLFGFVPVLPSGWNEFFGERPFAFYGSFAFTVLILIAIARTWPRRRELLLPLCWIVLFFAPLLPIFASNHHLYLPSAGMCWVFAIGLAALAQGEGRSRQWVAGVLVLLNAAGLSFLTWAFSWTYRASITVEDVFLRDVTEVRDDIKDGDHLFFINFPFYAYYAVSALKQSLPVEHLYGHVLTFSPWLSRMAQPGTIERVGDRTLVVTAPPGEGNEYLSGSGGNMLLKVMDVSRPFRPGDTVAAPHYDVFIDDADDHGIRRLRFVFKKPLDSPEYHFFFGSPVRWAYPLFRRD